MYYKMGHIFQGIGVEYILLVLFVGAASVVRTESGKEVLGSLRTPGGQVAAREGPPATNSLQRT